LCVTDSAILWLLQFCSATIRGLIFAQNERFYLLKYLFYE